MLKKESVKEFLIRTLKQTDIKYSSIKEIKFEEMFKCDCGKTIADSKVYVFSETFYTNDLGSKKITRSNLINVQECKKCGKQNCFCTIIDTNSKEYYYKINIE